LQLLRVGVTEANRRTLSHIVNIGMFVEDIATLPPDCHSE